MKQYVDISRDNLRNWLTDETGKSPTPQTILESEDAMLAFASEHALTPPARLKEGILAKIGDLNRQAQRRQKLQLDNLPPLTEHLNMFDWEEAVAGIESPEEFEDIHLHNIESNDRRELFVAWVKEKVDEEVHFDLIESFLILEGSCECHITNEKGECRIVRLGKGDHVSMQIGETHNLVITSRQPAKAILEWRKLAA